MNGRRGFMKVFVGALVASAIELRMTTAPVIEKVTPLRANYVAVEYMGEWKWINASMEPEWTKKYGKGSGYAEI